MAKKAAQSKKATDTDGQTPETQPAGEDTAKPECFVIMPISDQPGYKIGHFDEVYADVICPAVEDAGYSPVRADDVTQTNIIHEDILRRVLESPLAVCDLSARNPNVLFELGLRQAFDKPTVLLRDDKTDDVFDVGPLRYIRYGAHLGYRDVPRSQERLVAAIKDTMRAYEEGTLVNSLVRLLQISKAAELPDAPKFGLNEIREIMRAEVRDAMRQTHEEPVRRDGGSTTPPAMYVYRIEATLSRATKFRMSKQRESALACLRDAATIFRNHKSEMSTEQQQQAMRLIEREASDQRVPTAVLF